MNLEALQKLFSLEGHTALVTGSSRGIGRAIALTLGQAGARVIFHASKPSAKLDATVAEARAQNIDCLSATANLSDPDFLPALMASIPMPDILVLNASAQQYMHVEDFEPVEFTREFNTNVYAGTLLIKETLPSMKEKKFGRIITIGTVNEWKPAPRLASYAASKAAMTNIIEGCAKAYASYGITCNSVAPGVIDTDRNAEVLANPDLVAKLLSLIPASRFGQPIDLAGTVLLLASPAGAYITGANIPVTGGMHL